MARHLVIQMMYHHRRTVLFLLLSALQFPVTSVETVSQNSGRFFWKTPNWFPWFNDRSKFVKTGGHHRTSSTDKSLATSILSGVIPELFKWTLLEGSQEWLCPANINTFHALSGFWYYRIKHVHEYSCKLKQKTGPREVSQIDYNTTTLSCGQYNMTLSKGNMNRLLLDT